MADLRPESMKNATLLMDQSTRSSPGLVFEAGAPDANRVTVLSCNYVVITERVWYCFNQINPFQSR